MSPGKTEVKQGKFVESKSRGKGYSIETSKAQNINSIFPTPVHTEKSGAITTSGLHY